MSPGGDTVTTRGVPEVHPLALTNPVTTVQENDDQIGNIFMPICGYHGRYDNFLAELPGSLYREIDSG
jgi:hypothetical protein